MPPSRITIRLSPVLAARLAAKVGPRGNLADIVRHAIEAYLSAESPQRQPAPSPPVALADSLAPMAAIEEHLKGLDQRVTALEAVSASGSQPAATTARLTQVADSVAAVQAHLPRVEERLTALEAVAAISSHQQPERQPPQEPPRAARGDMRRRILALLQDHPEGLSPGRVPLSCG